MSQISWGGALTRPKVVGLSREDSKAKTFGYLKILPFQDEIEEEEEKS
jgi:hypothetical protein